MRATVTLDADVHHLVQAAMQSKGQSMAVVVNEALRRSLGDALQPEGYRAAPHDSPLATGIDVERLNHLADDLADSEAIQALQPGRRTIS